MFSNSPTYVLIRLSLALVATFAAGFYWLATKNRPTRRHAPFAPSRAHSAAGPRFVDVDKFDEWEAFAPYPDHVVHAAHEASAESGDSHPPFSQREEAPTHLLGPRLATTCNNAIESLTREPDKPIRRRQRPPRRRHRLQQSAVRVVCPRVSTRAIAPSRRAPRSPACGATGRLSALALSWPFSNQRCNRLGIATLLYLRAAVHTDWLRSALTTNTYTHAYTSTPGENGEFENISQDTDCIGPPCRIRTCGLRLRRPLLYPTELRAVDEKRHGSRHGPHPSEASNDRHPPFDAPKQNGPGMKPSPKLYPITAQYRARSASRHHTGCPCSMNHPKQNSPAITQYTPNAASRPRPSK